MGRFARRLRALAVVPLIAGPLLLAPGAAAAATTPDDDVVGGPRLAGAGVLVNRPAAVPPPPAPRAAGWLVADLDSGEVLAAAQPHRPLAPASTLKVLTALALTPLVKGDAVHTGTPADASIDGSKVGIVPASKYTRADVLNGLMLGSGNDCATALAQMAGGERAATEAMNATARRLGARDTVAANPSGLDAPGQVSSAYDLALISRAALDDPVVGKVMANPRYRFPAGGAALDGSRRRFEIQNHNKLLFSYDGATGGKTGYTIAARHSFVGSAERGGKRYVVTLMRAEGLAWQQAGKLLDWAFAHGSQVTPVGELVTPEQVEQQRRAAERPADTGASSARAAALPASRPAEDTSSLSGAGTLIAGGLILAGLVAVAAATGLLPLGRIGGAGRHRT